MIMEYVEATQNWSRKPNQQAVFLAGGSIMAIG